MDDEAAIRTQRTPASRRDRTNRRRFPVAAEVPAQAEVPAVVTAVQLAARPATLCPAKVGGTRVQHINFVGAVVSLQLPHN